MFMGSVWFDRWRSRLPILFLAGVGLVLCPEVSAHGGQYRGPTTPGSLSGLGGATTPGSAPRGPRGPTTGISASLGNFNSWQIWWEFNKDPFLRLKETIQSRGPVSGSDEFYMGNGRVGHRDKLDPSHPTNRPSPIPPCSSCCSSVKPSSACADHLLSRKAGRCKAQLSAGSFVPACSCPEG